MSPDDSTLRPTNFEGWIESRSSAPQHTLPSSGASPAKITLSVVVPAYNEQWRLPPALIDMIDYLDERQEGYEIIVVDDGSTDKTSEVVRKFQKIRPQVQLITLPKNCGKGYAVRQGVFKSRGEFVLFADADGSTPFAELERLRAALSGQVEIAIGSRALASTKTRVVTHWYRKYPGRLFSFCVNRLVLPQIADTQCGFKIFTARAAKFLFTHQRADGWSFDVEVLYIARRAGIQLAEVPINWVNIPGSKVNLMLDSIRMLWDICVFRLRHRSLEPIEYRSFSANSPK